MLWFEVSLGNNITKFRKKSRLMFCVLQVTKNGKAAAQACRIIFPGPSLMVSLQIYSLADKLAADAAPLAGKSLFPRRRETLQSRRVTDPSLPRQDVSPCLDI